MLSLVFTVLAICANANWTSPSVFIKKDFPLRYRNGFYDIRSQSMYALLYKGDNFETYFLKTRKGRLNEYSYIDMKTYNDIMGKEGGDNIFFAADFNLNIAFIESTDGGTTWKKPLAVSKSENCNYVEMRYIHETGRVYLIYLCDRKKLKFVSRPEGSLIFSPETEISEVKDAVFSTVYTLRRNAVTIHLFYANNNSIMYTSSKNNGVTWEQPEDTGLTSDYFKVYSNPKVSNSIFLLIRKKSEVYMIYSNDNGDTFSKPFKLDYPDNDLNMFVCGVKDGDKVLVISEKNYNEMKYLTLFRGWENNKLENRTEQIPSNYKKEYICVCSNDQPIELTILGQPDNYNEVATMEDTIDWPKSE